LEWLDDGREVAVWNECRERSIPDELEQYSSNDVSIEDG
jgi:hypothetical protein